MSRDRARERKDEEWSTFEALGFVPNGLIDAGASMKSSASRQLEVLCQCVKRRLLAVVSQTLNPIALGIRSHENG